MQITLTPEQLSELSKAIGRFARSDSNPEGVEFCYKSGDRPYKFYDREASESFETYKELLEHTHAMYSTLHQD